MRDKPSLLIAVGGNAIHPTRRPGTVEQQIEFAQKTANALLPIMQQDNRLVITHGNGPVVGKILMRQALTREVVPPMSMDVCVAHSQGGIAYLLMQTLENTLRLRQDSRKVVCLLTQVEVDASDPAFQQPTKPVGFFYQEESEARDIEEKLGWKMQQDAGRGWRYVVPSPRPQRIVDASLIETIADSGAIVIAGGGGGIPVIRNDDGTRHGVDAVIDKDLSSALMANTLGIDTLLILTAVDGVYVNFGTDQQQRLENVSVDELIQWRDSGEFAAGSMEPKVQAAIEFIQGGGKRAIIAHLEEVETALSGETGTSVRADS